MTQRMSKTEKPVRASSASKKSNKASNKATMEANLAKLEESENALVWFESRDREPRQFDVAGIRSIRNFENGRIEFRVPAKDVARFEQNHFVRNGRIVRKAV